LYYFTFPITLIVTIKIIIGRKKREAPPQRDNEELLEVSKEISEF